jgi:hypothetical protein
VIQAVTEAASRFRKKYTLVILMFVSGTTLAFLQTWTAEDYRWFCIVLLAIFGPMDLADNGTLPWGNSKSKEAPKA